MRKDTSSFLSEYQAIMSDFADYQKAKIPLCAAENYISKMPLEALSSDCEGQYIMSLVPDDSDFIGAERIRPLFSLGEKLARRIFNARYADLRTLSGMNCNSIAIMSLIKPGDSVILTTPPQGGHTSALSLLQNQGANVIEMPYSYHDFDIDYAALQRLIKAQKISFLYFCQSDLIKIPDMKRVAKILKGSGIVTIYDASQTLGFISAGLAENPVLNEKTLLLAGTHKTFPGPTSGLMLSNDKDIARILETSICPTFLRSVQPNKVASLVLSLIESLECGLPHQKKTLELSNSLCGFLQKEGFPVPTFPDSLFTETHQCFLIGLEKEATQRIYLRAMKYHITLNRKEKPLFEGFGIRLGTQEVARYGWGDEEMRLSAHLIKLLSLPNDNEKAILDIIGKLSRKKTPQFVLDED